MKSVDICCDIHILQVIKLYNLFSSSNFGIRHGNNSIVTDCLSITSQMVSEEQSRNFAFDYSDFVNDTH